MAIAETFNPETDHRLPDGYEIRVYAWGGIDARASSDLPFRTIASTPESCAALATLAASAAGPGPLPTLEAALAQDPVAVAARVVADLHALGRMAIERGDEAEAMQVAVLDKSAQRLLARANARAKP